MTKESKDTWTKDIRSGGAVKTAKEWVAVPGTSEHQLGMAVDINADQSRSANDDVYAWLAENAYRYGFILRYPKGREQVTGTEYEPWHYRYVGMEAAKEISIRVRYVWRNTWKIIETPEKFPVDTEIRLEYYTL